MRNRHGIGVLTKRNERMHDFLVTSFIKKIMMLWLVFLEALAFRLPEKAV